MSFKRILIVLFLVLMVFSVGRVNAQMPDVGGTLNDFTETGQNTLNKIVKFIKEQAPDFIVKPFKRMVRSVEGFRKSIIIKAETRKIKVEALIEPEKDEDSSNSVEPPLSDEEMKQAEATFPSYAVGFAEFAKAFKYLEVFLLIVLLFILSIPLFFYSFFVLAIILISRFFWFRIY